jgi:predicted Zn-dependent protease
LAQFSSRLAASLLARAARTAVTLAVALTLTLPVRAQTPELPTLGEVAADDLSPANERKLGEAIMRQVVRDPSYLPDPDSTEYINALGYQLVSASAARYLDFNFFVVRDPMLNAFALPGGFIGVHSGLVLTAQSESELETALAELGLETAEMSKENYHEVAERKLKKTGAQLEDLIFK